jgi:serine/threonine protein kinase
MAHDDETVRRLPRRVPGVELGEVLGAGGFGTVYRARHIALDVDVAVKMIDLRRVGAANPESLLREAQLMARLDHPNLLRVFDAGRLPEQIYVIFEFMDGGSCAGLRAVAPGIAADISHQLLSGLQALHDARILHRDIKPANCLKRRDDRIKLADLGLAVELSSETQQMMETAGTIPFMAPELFEAPPRFGPPSDIYALGMTLACFALESQPYPRAPLNELLPWIMNGPRPSIAARRPDLPTPLASLVDRMIAPHVESRPQSVAQALSALTAVTPAPAAQEGGSSDTLTRVGPWVIGNSVYASANWQGWAVTHYRTGAAGRLMRLQPDSALREVGDTVLAAAERAAKLDDRHVVPVLDWGSWDDLVFVVTGPWGHTMMDLVGVRGTFDEITALQFAGDLATAIVGIHGQGLVYQVLDPGSAVVAADARSAQLSWPIYCVPAGTPAQQRVLVPRYAAPEALTGTATIERAVDIFGLGALLQFLVTGVGPPRDTAIAPFARAHAPELTAATASFIAELAHADPTQRPTADAALLRIRGLLARLAR